MLGESGDCARYGGRKHQSAAVFRSFAQNKLKIFTKAKVKHFVSLVQHHSPQCRHIQGSALNVITQAPRCGDNDMSAARQCASFIAHIHSTHTRGQDCAGLGIEPGQFAFYLQCKFSRRGDHQRQRRACGGELQTVYQKVWCDGQAKTDSLARSGLCRYQQISGLKRRV